ncbi:MAG: AAA family ATPase [Clostridia bacterium]|nr:AAA family ATPase [Clostridia bacterium]
MNYWWLNMNPKIIRFREIEVGEIFEYSSLNEDGSERKFIHNFKEAMPGDIVIAFEIEPAKEILGICEVAVELINDKIYLRKIENLTDSITREEIEQNREIVNVEAFRNQAGTFFKLTDAEYKAIYSIIREQNPLKDYQIYDKYNKEKFLEEVFCTEKDYDELERLILMKKNVILQGAPGVGKTYMAKRMAYSLMGEKNDDRILSLQFHPEFQNEEFMEGYRPDGIGIYKFRKGCFRKFCNKARNKPDKKFFLIIDEINRGNITKIFGESFSLIEADKRGKQNFIELSCSKERFFIPENIYIIGTMNIADRDYAITDYAVRRRFGFYNVKPIFENQRFKKFYMQNEGMTRVIDEIIDINKDLKEGQKIGHCYFCENLSDEDLKMTVKYNIIPMIQEYFYDDQSKFKEIEHKLNNALNYENGKFNI